MANPRKFSEKIALHNQKQAEETAAFEKIMREVSDATNKVNTNSRRAKVKPPETEIIEILVPTQQGLGTFRSGSLPNVAAPQPPTTEPEVIKPEEATLATQYGLGGRSGGTSPTPRSPGQRGRASSSVGPMRRPADRKHDTSPYGSNVYLSPPPDSNWRRTNSDSALHQSCGSEQQVVAQPLSPHHPMHSHAHPHLHPHQNHRRSANMNLDVLNTLGMNPTNRPRSSCEIPRIPNNNNVYESGGDGGGGGGGGGLACGELQVPGGSLPDLTSVHFPPPHYMPHRTSPDYHQPRYVRTTALYTRAEGTAGEAAASCPTSPPCTSPRRTTCRTGPRQTTISPDTYVHCTVHESGGDGGGGGGELQVPGGSLPDLTSVHFPPPHYMPHRTSPDYHQPRYSPTSPGASPGGGSVSPATGGLSPASGSPVGATVPLATIHHDHTLYDTQNHLSVPNTNNYLHHNKNMSSLDHGWITSSQYQSHCSPPSQYSSTSNINIPSPTMVHSPGSPVESPQTDYNNLHQALLQPFEQITMLDSPTSNYNTTYINHSSPHSQQTTNSTHTYSQAYHSNVSLQSSHGGHNMHSAHGAHMGYAHTHPHAEHAQSVPAPEPRRARDPVAGGGAYSALQPLASPSHPATPATPASIPDIILTDYSGELDPGIFGGEEAQLRAGLDLDDLTLLEEPSALLPDSSVEHEFRLDRLDHL
ncbi:CREB-regulated transcription coactivator 1 [Bicyclus anynana]|uniref:CREB-regulated transcription coactivator 1 n=1 Tax=Bicyclus anynana TaxID=110368 RepID=A0A6J1MVX1_BICAN|nr:CREB-regulated transcription coactivator 1 [Bicyclus anynana]